MKVYLIGAGPGDPGLFTLKGKEVLEKADVVVYDYLANDALLQYARPEAEFIYAGKKGGDHTLPQEDINQLIIRKAKEGNVVARLKGGDPYMFGRGGEEGEELVEAGVPFEVVPGVTSAIAGPAYAGIPLTHRDHASSVCFATGHEDPTKPESSHNWEALAKGTSTLVFFMGMKNLPYIVEKLMTAGMSGETPAALVHWGTTTRHRSLRASLEDLPKAAEEQGFTAPSLIVIGSVTTLREKLNWYEEKPLLGKTIVVTRARQQASQSACLMAEAGAEVMQFPTISINPLDDYSETRKEIAKLSEYDWVVFTSVNGVKYFWEQMEDMGKDSRALGTCLISAVGPATAEELHKKGIVPDFIPERYVAEEIAQGLLDRGMKGKKLLLPRAKVARDVLPDALKEAGAEVKILPVYETKPSSEGKEKVLEAMEKGELDCITFGSSSTVTNFLSLIPQEKLKEHPEIKLACIGPITAKTLSDAGLHCDYMPEDYTIPAMVEGLKERLK